MAEHVPAHAACAFKGAPGHDGSTADGLHLLEEVYRTGQSEMVGLAHRLLILASIPASAVTAEDIVQSAFTKAFRKPEALELPHAYVCKVIRTEVAYHTRQFALRGRVDREQAADPLTRTEVADFSDLVANRESLYKAMHRLPVQQRSVVWDTKAMGHTQRATAEVMRIAPGTVATHASRGLAALRNAMGVLAVVMMTALTSLIGAALSQTLRAPPTGQPSTGLGLDGLTRYSSQLTFWGAAFLAFTAFVVNLLSFRSSPWMKWARQSFRRRRASRRASYRSRSDSPTTTSNQRAAASSRGAPPAMESGFSGGSFPDKNPPTSPY
ncbi:RNA polymerase sigma factor [Streptomyces sp. NPDC057137]|uniref:RNA polymerase sigma factor n=1 Tax=Streptomyces sp. NPDC057137 TaxID=3346030 RepID=UPI003641AC83